MSIMTFTQSSLYSIINTFLNEKSKMLPRKSNLNKQAYIKPVDRKSKIQKKEICKV